MALDYQQNVDIRIVVRKQVSMLERFLININLHYHYYTTYCIIFCMEILPLNLFAYYGRRNSTDPNCNYDKYLGISAWGNPGVNVMQKWKKKTKESNIDKKSKCAFINQTI